jgi:hypothetical protein
MFVMFDSIEGTRHAGDVSQKTWIDCFCSRLPAEFS